MEYGILGPFRLLGTDGRERTTAARQRELLALLVVRAGETLSADQLIDALWGEALPANPGNALQQRVFHVRRLLRGAGADDALLSVAGGYRLAVDLEVIDARRFERLADAGRHALEHDDTHRAEATLTSALALWRGDPLAGFDAPWAVAEARRLEDRRLTALEDRAEARLRLGGDPGLTTQLGTMVDAHPLRERLRGLLMRSLAADGRQAEAVQVYAETRELLAEELGVDPSPQLQRIHGALLTQDPPATTQATTAPAPSASLPTPTSRFIGRERELERLTVLLTSERLLTITGPGGAGKTRIALEVLGRLAGTVERPVFFVDLSTVVAPTAVPVAVAAALEVRVGAGAQVTGALRTALRDRPTQLVLDNCEHVLDAAAGLVAQLLPDCPRLRVLATSRTPLAVHGETVWTLSPLTVPPAHLTSRDDVLAFDAARLLVDRVAASRSDGVSDAEVPDVVRIVSDLDGLPLAIELAAARTRVLSLPDLADRLRDRFEVLTARQRGAPDRHRALAATLDWSWDLLDGTQQLAWMAASVPVGPWTTELLDRLLSAVDAPEDGLGAVTSLCDHSLLQVDEPGNPTRYRMLSSVREYAHARLAGTEADAVLRDTHARAVQDALAATDRSTVEVWDVDIDEQRRWLPDARAALQWRADQDDRRGMQQLAAGLGWLFYLGTLTAEGVAWLDAALGPIDGLEDTDVEPMAVVWAAGLRFADAAPDGLAWALRAAELAPDDHTRSLARSFVAVHRVLRGDLAGARELIRDEPGDAGWLEGVWRMLDARLLAVLGRIDEAEHTLAQAARLLGDDSLWSALAVSDAQVHLAQLRGDVDGVREAAARGIAACARFGAGEPETELHCLLSMVAAATGDLEAAEVELARAQPLAERPGAAMLDALVHQTRGYLCWQRGDLASARRSWTRVVTRQDWVGISPGHPFALWGLGHVALATGDVAEAARHQAAALETASEAGDLDAVATALEGAAAVAVAVGDHDRAARLLGAAAARRDHMGAPAPILTRSAAAATRTQVTDVLGGAAAAALAAGAAMEDPELRHLVLRPPSSD